MDIDQLFKILQKQNDMFIEISSPRCEFLENYKNKNLKYIF